MVAVSNTPPRRLEHEGVFQYLGVKYASLEHKFAKAQMYNYDSLDDANGLSHGPTAVMQPDACSQEFSIIQKKLPLAAQGLPSSDVDCLNLSLTIPAKENVSCLPVFVFIHGGGFASGSSGWPQYDLTKIVKQSVDMGMPVIGIGINYRLGPWGFLTSEELQRRGHVSNNGLHDQRVALRWIQKHIGMFGGDSRRVTCIGQSAGAISAMYHTASDEPLFQQIISMSGTPSMMPPLPQVAAQGIYESLIASLDFQELGCDERLHKLVAITAPDLLSKIPPGLPFLPVEDGDMVRQQYTHSELAVTLQIGRARSMPLMIGSCDADASIFDIMFAFKKRGCLQRFRALAEEMIPRHASKLFQFYQLGPDLNDSDAWLSVLDFANDISFHSPAIAYAASWPGTSYRYRFREPNQWEGAWKGHASHVLDVAYLFQNFQADMTASQANLAQRFGAHAISFINCIAPYPEYRQGQRHTEEYISEDGQVASKHLHKEDQVWQELFEDIGYDQLSKLWAQFLSR